MNLLAELSSVESLNLANLSFLSLFVSMIFYWIGTSFQDFKMNSSSGTASKGLVFSFSYTIAQYGILFSNLLLGLLLGLRWKESGHFPLSNLYESLMFLSWCFTGIHLFIEKFQENSKGGLTKTLVGAITTPSALLTNAFATFTLPKEMQEASPLVPALQSNWLMMHVTVMIISYAALIIGSLLSIAFLIITYSNTVSVSSSSSKMSAVVNDVGYQKPLESKSSILKTLYPEGVQAVIEEKLGLSNIALLLDNLSYRILGIGFPFLTIGILSGAVWANEAWGSYWSWDPKETWALLTWLIFAIYLHTRLSKGWEGKKPAIIAAFGFVIVWICYLGVNLIGEGLHSYGWITT
jgi:cytochrome c-type biogenesis protein CcsB